MKAAKNFLAVLLVCIPIVAVGQAYNIFYPGGDLTGTWNSQTVIAGAISDAKGSLSVKPACTVVATTNQALSGLPTIDGTATADGSIILDTAQSTGSQNGPWVAHVGAWTRPTWYASGSTTQAFQFITTFVRLGTLYQGTTWRQTATGPITIDTTTTTWAETPLSLNTSSVTGALPIANGGTGTASTLTGLVRGSGSAMTAAELSGDCTTSGSNAITCTKTNNVAFATSATTDTTNATNISSGTLALARQDLASARTYTGVATWSLTEPRLLLNQSGAGADLKLWDIDVASGVLTLRTRTDADAAGVNILAVTRGTTTAITDIAFGNATNNNTFTFNGTGTTGFGGAINTTKIQVSGSAVATNGMYLPAGNTVGFASNSVERFHITSAGITTDTGGFISGGTKFTASGCSNSATVGGATAGQFTSGTTGACTVVITLPAAPNGWSCNVNDLTSAANFIGQSASTTTSCTVTGTTAANDIIIFSAMAF